MFLSRFVRVFIRASAAHLGQRNWRERVIIFLLAGSVTICLLSVAEEILVDAIRDIRFTSLGSSTHLNLAQAACGYKLPANAGDLCKSPMEAEHQLAAIPKTAAEYSAASTLLSLIQRQLADEDAALQQKRSIDQRNEAQEATQRQVNAYDQMESNFRGQSTDPFTCATSTENTPIVSFNGGANWWKDDGRCKASEQKERDADAEIHSYYSNTLRVDTDMTSSWLPDEERICETSPNNKGEVAIVTCDLMKSGTNHNIPVTFWGSTERNTNSSWKCRREKDLLSDRFVCRALN